MRRLIFLVAYLMVVWTTMATTIIVDQANGGDQNTQVQNGDTLYLKGSNSAKITSNMMFTNTTSTCDSYITVFFDTISWKAGEWAEMLKFQTNDWNHETYFTLIFKGANSITSGNHSPIYVEKHTHLILKKGVGSTSSITMKTQNSASNTLFGDNPNNVSLEETTFVESITNNLTFTAACNKGASSSPNPITFVFGQKDLTKVFKIGSLNYDNATITADKTEALYGDTITVSSEVTKPNTYITELFYQDSLNKTTIIEGDKFRMPYKSVTVGATIIEAKTVPYDLTLNTDVSSYGFSNGENLSTNNEELSIEGGNVQLFIPTLFKKGKKYECTLTTFLEYTPNFGNDSIQFGIGSNSTWKSTDILSEKFVYQNYGRNTHSFTFTADKDYTFVGIEAKSLYNKLIFSTISINEVNEDSIPVIIETNEKVSLKLNTTLAKVGDSITVTVDSIKSGYELYEICAYTTNGTKLKVSEDGKFKVPSCAGITVKAISLKIYDPSEASINWITLTQVEGPEYYTEDLCKGEYTYVCMLKLKEGLGYTLNTTLYDHYGNKASLYSYYLGDSLIGSFSTDSTSSLDKTFIYADTTILFKTTANVFLMDYIHNLDINAFDYNHIPVHYTSNNSSFGTISGIDTVRYGDTVKVSIIKNDSSCYLVNPTANGISLNDDSTFVAPLSESVEVKANFIKAITPLPDNQDNYINSEYVALTNGARISYSSIRFSEGGIATLMLNLSKGKEYGIYSYVNYNYNNLKLSVGDSIFTNISGKFTVAKDSIYQLNIECTQNYNYLDYISIFELTDTVYIHNDSDDKGEIKGLPEGAKAHDTVYVTIIPDEGFITSLIEIEDLFGNKHPYFAVNDTLFGFEVPRAADISFIAHFAKIHEVTRENKYEAFPQGAPSEDDWLITEGDWYFESNLFYTEFDEATNQTCTAIHLSDSLVYELNTKLEAHTYSNDSAQTSIILYDSLWNEVSVLLDKAEFDSLNFSAPISVDKNGVYYIGFKCSFSDYSGVAILAFEVKAGENAITVLPSENGTVTCQKNYANEGAPIKLSINADMGYQLADIEITDTLSNVIPMAEDSSFTMPNSDVNISATFEKRVYNIIDSTAKDSDCSIEIQAEATMNEIVSFTVNIANGYQLDTLYVLDENGTKILVLEAPVIDLPSVTPGLTPLTPIEEQSTSTDYIFLMPASNVTVHAEYSKIIYSIDLSDAQTTKGAVASNVESASFGDTITLTGMNLAKGYQIDTLYVLDENGDEVVLNNNSFVMPASNVTVHAEYSKSIYSIDMTDAQSTNGSVSVSPTSASIDDIVHIVSIKPAKGYQIDTLYVLDENDDEIALNNKSFVMPASNVTVHATFSKIIYSIDATDAEHDDCYITLSDSTATFGQTITVNTVLAPGYQIDDVYVLDENENGISIENNSFVMPAGNVTVHATFSKIDFTIDATDTEANDCYVIFDKTNATVNETVKVDDIALAEGYQIDTLYVLDENGEEVASTDSSFVMPASNVTIHATYSKINTTSVSEVMKEDVALSSNEGTIYCNRSFNIYTISGVDATKRNGSLQGVYLVKVDEKIYKVIVR